MGNKKMVLLTGLVIGILALVLGRFGNPANMGVCIACFLRDTAGGLGLHKGQLVQYVRPEIMGIVLGAFVVALASREFKSSGGSSTMTRFLLGFIMMIGMLIFLGCPLRVALRLGAGDLNALVGFAGLFIGVGAGSFFLKSGFTLGKATPQNKVSGYIFPLLMLVVLLFAVVGASFLVASKEGPGSMHASLPLALVAGLIIGGLAQRSRFCMAGGIRDLLLFRNCHLIIGFVIIIAVVLVGSLYLGNFKLGVAKQPIAHTEAVWNFLGLALAGWSAALLGGCPLRQLVLAGQGNTDSAVTVLGLITGAAFAHNFGIAASPKGVPALGQVAVIVGLVTVLAISLGTFIKLPATEGSDTVVHS